jgi:hypothetical protein
MEITKEENKINKFIKIWNTLPFQRDIFQIIFTAFYFLVMLSLIIIRDGFYISINKYLFVAISVFILIFLRKEYIIYSFAFILPFSMALPTNWVMLVFFIILFVKNKCRLNLAQIVFPVTFGIIEFLLVIKAEGFSNTNDLFKAFQYFSFLLFACYLLLDKHLVINKKKLSLYLIAGTLLMCFITFFIQLNMMQQLVEYRPDYKLIDILLDPYIRLENVTLFNEWITMMAESPIIVFPETDMSIGDDPNNMAFYLLIAAAFLLYITTKEKKNYITTLVLLVAIGAFGIYTKSRSFYIAFPVILITWYVIALISKRLKITSLLWVGGTLLICFLVLLILNQYFDVFKSIFGRFININESDQETGRFALIIKYLTSMFSNWFTALFGTGVICMQTVLHQDVSSHTAIIQIFVSYGIIGSSLFAVMCGYIIYVRCHNRKNLIDLNSFIPIFAAVIFTLALQVLNPYFIMIVCAFTVMATNNFSTIKQTDTKFSLLTNIMFLNHPEEEILTEYSGDRENNIPFVEYRRQHLIEKETRIAQRRLRQESQKNNKIDATIISESTSEEMVHKHHIDEQIITLNDVVCDEMVLLKDDGKIKWYNKFNNFINDLYERVNLYSIIKTIKSSTGQLILLILFATLVELYACIVSFLGISSAKIFMVILFGFVILLMSKKSIILSFAFVISMSNFMPQRYLFLFFLVSYLLKNKFRFNVAQIAFAGTFIIFELLDCFIFGFTDAKESLSFLMIVSFLIYVCLDQTLRINIKALCISYLIGFLFTSIMLIYPFIYYSQYSIDHAIVESDVKMFDIIVNNKFRLGDYKTLFWYLNETFHASLNLQMIPALSDNPNNIAFFAFFAIISCFMLFSKKVSINILVSVFMILCFGVGLLTKSKTLIIALGIVLLLFYIFAIVEKKITPLTSLLIFVGIIIAFVIYCICDPSFTNINYYFTRPDIEGGDNSGRMQIIKEYLNFMFTNPQYLFTGTGLLNILTESGFGAAPHTNILQVFVAYGFLGTILILMGFAYAIYVRVYYHKLNLYALVPIAGIIFYTFTLQVLSPYELMYPFLISLLFINNGNYIIEKGNKIKGLFYLWPYNHKIKG